MARLCAVAILGVCQVVMLTLMWALLTSIDPEPNGFRLDDPWEIAFFAVATAPPIVIGLLGARGRVAVLIIGGIQALSPLLLLGTMLDPDEDLNFALLLWWWYLPAVAVLVLVIERWLLRRAVSTR